VAGPWCQRGDSPAASQAVAVAEGRLFGAECAYFVEVKATTSAYREHVTAELPAWKARGRPPVARYHAKPSSLRDLLLAAGADIAADVTWREGSRGR
jgi:hypothetical protein